MMTLHIKIIELLTEEKHTSMNPLNIFFLCNGAINTKFFKLKITKNKNDNTLQCQKAISYDLSTQNNCDLVIELKRHRVIVSDDALGKLTLPLSWFPTNHVVREWFPFKAASKKIKSAMVLLDIHVDSRKATPFMAPFATLRVFPCWKRPTQTMNSDFPVPPPMVYVLSSAEQRVIPLQQLRVIASNQQANQQIPQASPGAQPIAQNYTPIVATQSQLNPNINVQQQQHVQRTQSSAQQPVRNSNSQRAQSQFIPQQQQHQQPMSVQPQQTSPLRPTPFPSYPDHSSSDGELEKDEEEIQPTQNQPDQQNTYPYYPPSGQPYQDNLYVPPVSQNDQYNAPVYQPPQANPNSNTTTYTPAIY